LFAVFFLVIAILLVGGGAVGIQRNLDRRLDRELFGLNDFMLRIGHTMDALRTKPNTPPCSDSFIKWMHRVAFLPDGVHEIIYVEDGQMVCSVAAGKLAEPIPLDEPDYLGPPDGSHRIWLERDLGMLGFPGVVATFISVDNFILVVPIPGLSTAPPGHMEYEIVNRALDGTVWHVDGAYGLYDAVSGVSDNLSVDRASPTGFTALGCVKQTFCVVFSEPLAPLLKAASPVIFGGVVLAVLLAGVLANIVRNYLAKEWGLPARIRYRLSVETVVCHYQPLLDLHEERICGVEVLARWRDDDGALIYPDQFLPIIEQSGLQYAFTRHIVDRAYRELSALTDFPEPLTVHFNIFPCDFDPDGMLELFEDFLAEKSRFTVVIELIESDALPIDRARDTVDRLKQAGILTFIDDFGAGYSSIGYLAGLGTHGVKLDRSFGLAPEGSLTDAIFTSAIDMVAKTGQTIVVEGVETASRLASLKENKAVRIAQGYFISRPLDIDSLKVLLSRTTHRKKAKVA
jgi:sensor c-di-GMP phosphodiesterase-like protein